MTETLACLRAARGTCPRCDDTDRLLYAGDVLEGLACPDCIRSAAKGISRWQPCDNHPDRHAWRNPYTRRDEYLCGQCHAESGDGVVLNKWAPRVSTPLGIQERPDCEARNVPGTRDCRGEVKPRKGVNLCNAHAGKESSAAPYTETSSR